jgi:hypothetical protein
MVKPGKTPEHERVGHPPQLTLIALGLSIALPLVCLSSTTLRAVDPPQERWVEYAPAKTTLTGKLVIETKLGPPGYGEDPKHDRKVRIYVLRLTSPVSLRGGDERKGDQNIHELEIFFHSRQDTATWDSGHAALGKCVTLIGELRGADMGADYTPVVMWVDQLAVADAKKDPCGAR